jgi:hypothetical protein
MFSLSSQVKTTLAPDILCTFTQLLEAQYHYNNTLLELDEAGPTYLPNMLAMHLPQQKGEIFRGSLTSLYKKEVSKEKESYQKYLQRIRTESNQQKVLDDFFEDVRKALHSNLSIACRNGKTFLSSFISTFFIQPLQDVSKTISPHISSFQQYFSEYNKLLSVPTGGESRYEVHTAPFQDFILGELEKLKRDYEIHQDADGAADILRRQGFFEMEFMVAYLQFFPSEPVELNYKMNREWFYALCSSLENARVLHERRKLLWQKKTIPTEPIVVTGVLPKPPEGPLENRDISLEVRLVEATEKLAIKSTALAELEEPAEEVAIAISSASASARLAPTEPTIQKKPDLIFSKNKNKKNKEKIPEKESDHLPAFQVILRGKYKEELVDLFFGKNLEKIHIPEKTLKLMVEAIGGIVTDGAGSRKRIVYQGKLGFVPNEPSGSVVAHYHTKNTRHACPAVLAHYRDFFHRIQLTPSKLWPNEYSEQDYTFNRTTRRHLKVISGQSSSF